MNAHDEERMKELLKHAVPPMSDAEPERDLWPAMLSRMDKKPAAPPWFDWALASGLAIFVAVFPASIPVFFYYL